jgi:DNA-binding response OmpR family regulator
MAALPTTTHTHHSASPRPPSRVQPRILVVEDDPDIRDLVRMTLEQEGFAVMATAEGEHALEIVSQQRPALVLLDLMLPGISGLDVCRLIRASEATAHVPIAIISAKASETDRIVGLEMGADDYITKPFSPRELVARIRAVLRRARVVRSTRSHEVYEKGRLRVDFDTYEVVLDGRKADLALREFQLLRFFLRAPNRVFSRTQILDAVWGHELHVETRTVDVHVRRLRARIERDQAHPELNCHRARRRLPLRRARAELTVAAPGKPDSQA